MKKENLNPLEKIHFLLDVFEKDHDNETANKYVTIFILLKELLSQE